MVLRCPKLAAAAALTRGRFSPSASIRGSTPRLPPISPRARAAAARTVALSSSFRAAIRGATARLSFNFPSEIAAALRTSDCSLSSNDTRMRAPLL